MKNLKKISLQLPEYLLITALMFYWVSAGMWINPIAIGLIFALILQIVFKNRIIGIIIPSLLILTSFFLLLALISEFNEFPYFTSDAKKLLFVGLSYFISTLLISGIMIYKYSTMETRNDKISDMQN
jgi:energy-coupling factor transporter transmembrane protein EcfT